VSSNKSNWQELLDEEVLLHLNDLDYLQSVQNAVRHEINALTERLANKCFIADINEGPEWKFQLFGDIILNAHNRTHLESIHAILSGKSIFLDTLMKNPDLKQEYLEDPRTKRMIQVI